MARNQSVSIWIVIVAALLMVLVVLALSNNFTNSALAAHYPIENQVTSLVSPQ